MGHVAEEVRRGEQRKDSSSRGTAAAPAPKMAASHESRENLIEPDPNPKKRLLIQSASSAASGGGQQRVKRSATDSEPESTNWSSDGNWYWRKCSIAQRLDCKHQTKFFQNSVPVAVTAQEGIDGYREKQ